MSFQTQANRRAIINRSKDIAAVFLKYGIPIHSLFPGMRVRVKKTATIGSNVGMNRRLRLALQELGPTFIKFGQVMSTRPDLVTPELASELKLLTDNVETVDWAAIKPVIEEYCSISETFSSIDEKPIGAASLSQAHTGKLKDGTVVVLKIQRPGIRGTVEIDLQIVKAIAKTAKPPPELKMFNLPKATEEFSRQLLSELDFTRDGRNADLLAHNMQSINGIRIPKIYWQCSGERLLVMEYMKGVRIDEVKKIKDMGVDPKHIAILGFRAYWKQVIDDGFFHGDPHPGNLLATQQGDLVFLDFGLFGVVRPEKRDALLRLLLGLVNRDIDLIVDALGFFGIVVDDTQIDAFKDDIYLTLVQNESVTIKPDIRLLDNLVQLMKKYKLSIPSSLMLMIKVFGMVQDVCSKLYPEFVLLEEARPLLIESFKGRIEKEANIQQIGLSLVKKFDGLKEFPKNVNLILRQLSKGFLVLKIPDDDLVRLERIADKTSYRILLGLVTASIVIGMSLVLFATQSALSSVPVQLVVLAYAIAVLIVVLSAVELMRSRRKH